MASEKQIEANRRNAALSTGPKTEEGKAKSRENAMTHGLTSEVIRPEEQKEALKERLSEWCEIVRPEDRQQHFELELAVEATLQVENCRERALVRRIALAKVAAKNGADWESDRRKEADRLGRSLKRNPEGIALQLRSTPAGRNWLLGRWKLLLIAVEDIQWPSWTVTQSNEALDLLGSPRPFRKLILEHKNPFPDAATIQALILKEIADLEALQVDDAEQDAELRDLHAQGLIFETDAQLTLIHRYKMSAIRRYEKSMKVIKQAKAASVVKPRQNSASTELSVPATPDYETKPISPLTSTLAAQVAITPVPPPNCETKPIPASVSTAITASDLMPKASLVDAIAKKLPGNRRLRRKLQKEGRLEAYLASKAG